MSNVVSALNGQKVVGATTVAEQGLRGMITLRGDLSAARLKKACKAVTGAEMPGKRGVSIKGESGIAWMSPDELLLLVPHSEADAIVAKIDAALKGTHFLAVNVSDARAMISVQGAGAREVLARVCPADLRAKSLGAGEMRRTRLAQVPAAIWTQDGTDFNVICFRSVAGYVFDLLANAAATDGPGML